MSLRWPPDWGWPAAVGLLALAVAAPLALWLTPLWLGDAALLSRAASPPAARRATAEAPQPPLPVVRDGTRAVTELLRQAVMDGLAIERVQQRLETGGARPRLVISVSARGRYAQLRAHVEHGLALDEALALERLQFRRAEATADELDAEFEWSVLVETVRPGVAP